MKQLASLILTLCLVQTAHAQMWDELCVSPLGTDTAHSHVLEVRVDAMAFFHDNEYDASFVTNGYTLPGVWVRPVLSYNPIDEIHLELGAYAIFYDGANKYPNYAFHDIATWKGQQYKKGVHALPFFRAEAKLNNLSVVLGDLYGAQNHQLIDPMYNPELNVSCDPEMGAQLLLDRKRVHLDTWIDWQSYIFELDSHQEAFSFGTNVTLLWNPDTEGRIKWSTPVQLLIQHRGGQQDTTSLGVQTVANASLGARMDYAVPRRNVGNLRAEANVLVSYQMKGNLWPFDSGIALHAAVGLGLWKGIYVKAGYFEAPRHFANLYGNPFFSTLSLKHEGEQFHGMHTAYLHADYTYTFTPAYKLGAQVEAYSANTPGQHDTSFSFGLYLRVSPHIKIKRFDK